jgi:putative membrane protein (TIGR04086 family)
MFQGGIQLGYDKNGGVQGNMSKSIKSIVLGTAVGGIMCMLCLFVFAIFFVSAKVIPQTMIQPLILVSCALGAFIGGYITVRILRVQGLLFGILSGMLLFVIVCLVSVIAIREPFSTFALVKGVLMMLAGAIGGIIGVNKRSKRK